MSLSIVCYDTAFHDKSIQAIEKTLECKPADIVYWFSDKPIEKKLAAPVVWVPIDRIRNESLQEFTHDTNVLCFQTIPGVVDTDHALYVQYDGFAVNPEAWTDDFLQYDYIGAPWPQNNLAVGNGGFSLRSRALHKGLLQAKVPAYFMQVAAEDSMICLWMRTELENTLGIKFAPLEVAAQFAIERTDDIPALAKWVGKSFGFHERWHCEAYGYDPQVLKGVKRPYE